MILQVFEHQRIRVNTTTFQKSHFEALVRFNEQNGSRYFNVLRQGIQFKHYVGVLQVGKLTLEILPKADGHHRPDAKQWQSVLLHMLKTCKHLKVEAFQYALLKLRSNSILDLYIELYLKEIEVLLRKGLAKQYRPHTANVKVFKGTLQFQKHLQKNLIHQERFYTKHQCYDYENIINAILRKALEVINNIHLKSHLKQTVQQLLKRFPDIPTGSISINSFRQVRLNRQTQDYQKALDIARLFIGNFRPDLRHGRENVLAILFDMNRLFEEYVFRSLKKLEKTRNIIVKDQQTKRFWERKNMRPDIVLIYKDQQYILDTKWKILKTRNPSDEDLRQVYVYQQYFDAASSVLIYPKVFASHVSRKGVYQKPLFDEASFERKWLECRLCFVDVVDYRNIGEAILENVIGV